MTKIKILDSGYLSATTALTSQTQITATNRAGYTGSTVSAFSLDTANLSLNGSVGIEDKPIINTLVESQTSLISVTNRRIPINVIVRKTMVADGFQYTKLYQLARLERTHGLKILYLDSAADGAIPTIIEVFGAPNIGQSPFASATASDATGTVGLTIPYLVGRVRDVSISDDASGNYWRVSFTFELTG
jgi:hypothetical protein